ncbi:MAG TPA: AtpZ/AtpI family protein [Dehalococcoidia bacterium]|nr:AtpZ/AtpI family protein [Dehalococcoidia bacterium]
MEISLSFSVRSEWEDRKYLFIGFKNGLAPKAVILKEDGLPNWYTTLSQKKTHDTVQQIKTKKPTSREWVKPLWFLFNVGWYVALSIVIPTGIGYWLDRPDKFDSHPLFTLVGFGVGTVAAFYGLYRMLHRFYTEQKETQKDKK